MQNLFDVPRANKAVAFAVASKLPMTEFYSRVKFSHMKFTRYLFPQVKADLAGKMVLIGGPRQVGKTTLPKEFIQDKSQHLTWDDLEDRALV